MQQDGRLYKKGKTMINRPGVAGAVSKITSVLNLFINSVSQSVILYTLYTSGKPLQHLLAKGVPSCEELRGADLQNLQGGAATPHQTETR